MKREQFGDSLKAYRCAKGWTQALAAQVCGISEREWRRLESRQSEPKLSTLNAIAVGLHLDLNEMVLHQRMLPAGETLFRYSFLPAAKKEAGFGFQVEYMETGEILTYPDVHTDRYRVEHFVKLCNLLQVQPAHLEDLMEDELWCGDETADKPICL